MREITTAIARVLDQGSIAALVTLIAALTNVGAKLLIEESGATTGSLGDQGLNNAASSFASRFIQSRDEAHTFSLAELIPEAESRKDTRLLFERIEPEPRIVICGAGHVGASLARLAGLAGYRATLIDDRAEFVERSRFPDERIDLLPASTWAGAVREAIGNGHGVSVAIVTRGHNEDEECLRAAVASKPDYLGLIGSKRRTNIVLERIRATGADQEQLKNVHAPIGLDIGAVTPEEVALAILSEIVAARRGGKGGSLSIRRRE